MENNIPAEEIPDILDELIGCNYNPMGRKRLDQLFGWVAGFLDGLECIAEERYYPTDARVRATEILDMAHGYGLFLIGDDDIPDVLALLDREQK